MQEYALMLGATGPHSLGRLIALNFLEVGITPILIGRTADVASRDSTLKGCEFITADLCDPAVDRIVMRRIGPDTSNITYFVIAGGGPHLRGEIVESKRADQDAVWHSILLGPTRLLQAFHAVTEHPYTLVTIASTSAYKIRTDETIYATAQAARAQYSKNFDAELMTREGARNLIFYPGGMQTGLWEGTNTDTDTFMSAETVARVIWETLTETHPVRIRTTTVIERPMLGTTEHDCRVFDIPWNN